MATDLHVTSVDAVNWKDQPEVRDFAPFEEVLSPSDVAGMIARGTWRPREKADALVLRIRWVTEVDLREFMRQERVLLYVTSALCADGPRALSLGLDSGPKIGPADIFDQSGWINLAPEYHSENSIQTTSISDRREYHHFVWVYMKKIEGFYMSRSVAQDLDLLSHPSDICFRIVSLGRIIKFQTPMIRIPAYVVSSALNRRSPAVPLTFPPWRQNPLQ